ncbi:hypothetical protein GOBAR_AA19400 [Gossypium barbadense]|uniref:Uncharacterized protein n=1 Tax=Gossypium barbadense TaxID=3634 RepID=A0A2P5XD46_GOSBA|nr:hypothetical protein GOBAR_AA19400 [Gossypium barbadense]
MMRVEEDTPVVVESWRSFASGVFSPIDDELWSSMYIALNRCQSMKPPHELDDIWVVPEKVVLMTQRDISSNVFWVLLLGGLDEVVLRRVVATSFLDHPHMYRDALWGHLADESDGG